MTSCSHQPTLKQIDNEKYILCVLCNQLLCFTCGGSGYVATYIGRHIIAATKKDCKKCDATGMLKNKTGRK